MKSTAGARVCIIGTGSWGTTLSILLSEKGLEVTLQARSEEEARLLSECRENRRFLPGFIFPDALSVSHSLPEAVSQASLILVAVPSQSLRETARALGPVLSEAGSRALIVSAAKGLEIGSRRRMSEVLAEELPDHLGDSICALSGPNLSHEIALGKPATTVVASHNLQAAKEAQRILMTPRFRVYVNEDVVGVELGGALKNIIALGAGICDGLGLGDNGKASLVTRGLAEIVRLGNRLGASPLTLYGLAGLGDMIATCASTYSRNHYVGFELAKGRSLEEITGSMTGVAEGIPTTAATRELAGKLGIEMPITEQMYAVLFEGRAPTQAIAGLMLRQAKNELHGLASDGPVP